MSARRSAPLGVKVVAALGVIGSVLGLLAGVVLLGASGQAPQAGTLIAGVGLVVILLSGVQLVALYGLLKLTSWGYKWTMALYGLSIAINLLGVASGAASQLVAVVIQLAIVAYLYSVRDVFVGSNRPISDTRGDTAATRQRRSRR